MNSDEIKSLIVKVLLVALSPLATKLGLDGNTTASVCAWLGTGIVLAYGIYDHWNSKKVPENATAIMLQTPPLPAGALVNLKSVDTAKVVGTLLAGFFVLSFASVSFGATPTPTPRPAAAGKLTTTQAAANPLAVLNQFTVADLEAALADAQASGDKVSAPCWQALLTAVQAQQAPNLALPSGVFSGIQKARDLKMAAANLLSQSGPLSGLNVACAPLVLDVNNTLLMLGISTGIVVGSGGLSLPALPGLLPMLLAPK